MHANRALPLHPPASSAALLAVQRAALSDPARSQWVFPSQGKALLRLSERDLQEQGVRCTLE